MVETKKVNLELEIDTNTVDSSKNRYQGLIDPRKSNRQLENIPEYSSLLTFSYYTKL